MDPITLIMAGAGYLLLKQDERQRKMKRARELASRFAPLTFQEEAELKRLLQELGVRSS